MATIKNYTDLSQSKMLAEFLPIKSADHFHIIGHHHTDGPRYEVIRSRNEVVETDKYWPCWSLTALLDVLPNENMLVKTTCCEYYCLTKDVMTKHYDNPVDACVAMIEKLHELKML